MNPNSYGHPTSQQQQQPQQSMPPAQYPPTWPPAQQQPATEAPNGAPLTSSSLGSTQPTLSQGTFNGNYQQQLASSMSGLSVNPTKQSLDANIMSIPASHHEPTTLSNGPQSQGPQVGANPSVAPPSAHSNNNLPISFNNNIAPGSYGNGQLPASAAPPVQSQPTYPPMAREQLQQQQQKQQQGGAAAPTPPPPTSGPSIMPFSAMPGASPQSIPGGANQMSIKSANVHGLPHMPPPITTTSSFVSPLAGHSTPLIGAQQQSGGSFITTHGGIPHSGVPGQQPFSMHSGLSGPYQSTPTQQMPTRPGQASTQNQQAFDQKQPMMTPLHGQHPINGPVLMPGQPPISIQSPMSGPPPMSGAPPMSGQPPLSGQPIMQRQQPGQPPMFGQSSMQGQPPFHPQAQQLRPGQSSLIGQPPMPGQQSPMPGHLPMVGHQPPIPGQPLISGQPSLPGPHPSVPGQPQMSGPASMPGQPSMAGYQQQQPSGYPGSMPSGYPNQMMAPPGQPGQQITGRPGYNQPPAHGEMYQQQYQSAQRRLDPDQMPNPIQVMIENQRNAGGPFVVNQPGLLPPLVTTKFVVQDQGNSSPRFVRSSLYCIPASADLLKTTALPFTLIVSPFARIVKGEYDPPIVDFGELGPVRCNRCKAYMSPNMQFIDAGRRFQCLMCRVSTEVPTEYFQHLDHTGQRMDKYERPELVLGTYEFLATKDYCRNNTSPEIPAFIFVIDVSYNTIKSGLVHLLCSQVKRILQNLPVDQGQEKSQMRVGFITYNSTVHFYNIKSNLAQPQMMVVGDVHDMFMPLLDGFLCHPEESEAVIDALMEQIPKMFVDTKETETVLYPAIQAGCEAFKASNCAGKLLVFNSSLPIAEAPGKLKNRDDRKLLGTEKEKTILVPQCTAYNTLGQDCVQVGCSVDLFLFNNSYIDIATIGQVARLTGGEVFKYTYFQADTDGKRLIEDIIKNISRPIAFDSVMRVRTSAGVRPTDFYGHYFMTNTTDVELASIDANKSIAIEIKHDDKLPPEENVYLQIALLYTSCGGQRRLRVFNLALRATTTISDVFKSCDLDALMLFLAKQACFKLMELTPKTVKDNLIHRTAQTLACYRKHCTSPTSAGQLILPECLKLLPLYISCLIKNDAISGGSDMTLDDRSFVIQFLLSMDLNMSVSYLYPRMIPIHNVDPDDKDLPMSIRCTHEKMAEDGAYILENGVHLFVWLGQSLPQSFIQPLFGVQCTQQVNAERFVITADTPLANRVRNILEMVMAERTRYMRVTCVRQNDKLESVFRHFLIEDRGTDGSASYVDFLCHMHKEIKELLS